MRYDSYIKGLFTAFPTGKLTKNEEFVCEEKGNVFINLAGCYDKRDVQVMILEYCSRSAAKGQPYKKEKQNEKYRKKLQEAFNVYLGVTLSGTDWQIIYDLLGNGVRHALALEFLEGGMDMKMLYERHKEIRGDSQEEA